MPKVSVIIPVYNAEGYLRECLESAVSQTFGDTEIICVNDGSTDGSGDILREYARRDERINVVEQENRGVSSARNRALGMASGDYVLFLDSDDFFEPEAVEEAYSRCIKDDADIGIFKYRFVDADGSGPTDVNWSLRMDLVPDAVPFSHGDMAASVFTLTTPCVWNQMFKRSFIVDAGLHFFPELKRAEDLPFTYLALVFASRITVIDKILINYRIGLASSSQATIHEAPNEICKALALTKRTAVEAGVFEGIERDFAETALDQCLFTLRTVKTVESFRELYAELKDRYFVELGIDGRAEDDFLKRQHSQYIMIKSGPVDAYLFDEDRLLRSQLASRLDELQRVRTKRDETHDHLVKANAAHEVTHGRLVKANAALRETRAQLKKTTARLTKIEQSGSYRAAQRIASINRKIRQVFTIRRKAE